MPFTVSDESGTSTGERVITAALPQWKLDRTEVAEMHHGEHTTTTATHTPSTSSKKNSASLSALMSVKADTGLCHVTRLIKITARARGHTNFDLNGPLL